MPKFCRLIQGLENEDPKLKLNQQNILGQNSQSLQLRALPDITSNPEVRKFFEIRAVRKPDVFLPEGRAFNTFKHSKKTSFFSIEKKCLFVYMV